MARISTYPVDQNPEGTDILLGTDASGGTAATKNFRISDISTKLLNEWLLNTNWVFNVDEVDAPYLKSQLYFTTGGGDNTLWSNITTIRATLLMKNNSSSEKYLRYLLTNDPLTGQPVTGNKIKIFDRNDLSSFGVFTFTSLTLVAGETFIYDLGLTFVEGAGAIRDAYIYGIAISASYTDKNYVFSQAVASATWSVQHNLNKFPSCTMVLSTGQQGYGDVVFIDENNLTITFASAETGKAYIN
jgi:hypothetical protein